MEAIKQTDRSLLAYPGGKSFVRKFLYNKMPPLTRELVSPFFGGGSLEFYAGAQGVRVYGSDNFRQLVLFWNAVIADPVAVSKEIEKLLPVNKLKRTRFINAEPELSAEYAAKFLLALKYNFGGTLLSTGYVDRGDLVGFLAARQVKNFLVRNVSVECLSWQEALNKHPNVFGFFDPPYQPSGRLGLYGADRNDHHRFDEDSFFDVIAERDGWVMTNANCDKVRKRFAGFRQEKFSLRYSMRSRFLDSSTEEILIFSKN